MSKTFKKVYIAPTGDRGELTVYKSVLGFAADNVLIAVFITSLTSLVEFTIHAYGCDDESIEFYRQRKDPFYTNMSAKLQRDGLYNPGKTEHYLYDATDFVYLTDTPYPTLADYFQTGNSAYCFVFETCDPFWPGGV